MSRNKVVLVRQGDAYQSKYVAILSEQIKSFDPDIKVITLTDQEDTPGDVRPLKHGLKGWWAKLELFAPENADLRPFLYIDLDSYVMGPLAGMFGGHQFKMVKDFMACSPANSSVMWIPGNAGRIWEKFKENPKYYMDLAGKRGDQHYLGQFVEAFWGDEVQSYKVHCQDYPKGRIIQFHGKPKPHDAVGWAGRIWAGFDAGNPSKSP